MRFKRQYFLNFYLGLLFLKVSTAFSHALPIKIVNSGYNQENIIEYTQNIQYGPILVDINSFYYKDKTFIIKGVNHYSKTIYLAIDCIGSKLNVSDPSLVWSSWSTPVKSFEKHLLQDYCSLSR